MPNKVVAGKSNAVVASATLTDIGNPLTTTPQMVLNNECNDLIFSITNTGTNLSSFSLLVQPCYGDAFQTYLNGTGWDSAAASTTALTLKKVITSSGALKTLPTGATGYAHVDIGPVYAVKWQAAVTSGALSTGTLTLTGLPTAAQTMTIGTTVYTFRASVSTTANEILIGADAAATCTNIIAAITAGSGSGTLYGSATVAHTQVTASQGAGTTVTITALPTVNMTVGNAIATTETMSNASFGAATLGSGVTTAVVINAAAY